MGIESIFRRAGKDGSYLVLRRGKRLISKRDRIQVKAPKFRGKRNNEGGGSELLEMDGEAGIDEMGDLRDQLGLE